MALNPSNSSNFNQSINHLFVLGLHRISYPAPAEIRPNFYIRPYPAAGYEAGYEVGFDHLSMHLPHCVIGRNSLFYKFDNLHLSISLWACGSYPHPRFRLLSTHTDRHVVDISSTVCLCVYVCACMCPQDFL